MSIKSFGAEIQNFVKTSELETDIVIRKIAMELFDGITAKTPVDTGRAKGNWNLSARRKDTSVNDKTSSTPLGSKGTPEFSLKKGDGLSNIYITNSLPYIHALENGHSGQASTGMVDLTVNEVKSSFS